MERSLLILILVLGVLYVLFGEFFGEQKFITKGVKLVMGNKSTDKSLLDSIF